MTNKEIGLAPYHIPTVLAGEYNITAELNQKNNVDESTVLNEGKKQEIKFSVAGYNAAIPQNEVLAVYPPIDHTGNFAGTFPHIQFRRSSLPWEYEVKHGNDRLPYIFLLLLKEEELKDLEIITTDTNSLNGSTESPAEPKPLQVIKHNGSELFPKAGLIQKLAHVRVQEHTELKDLNLPKETSILVSHRMVEPNTKYKAFVCYYASKIKDGVEKGKYKMITDLTDNSAPEYAVIVNEWSFESVRAELYQIDSNKLKNHMDYNGFKEGLIDSEIGLIESIKSKANTKLLELIQNNEKYIAERNKKWEMWKEENKGKSVDIFEKFVETITIANTQYKDNHILEYIQYNGKNLKGYLHELELQPFKSFIKSPTLPDAPKKEDLDKDVITKLLNTSRVPLEHQLKAGGKMVSWYQGPFTNNSNNFDLLQLLADQKIETIPDHQDYLNLFNEDTGMYDMAYSTAWQLGRLMIINNNKVIQELKKWKYELKLYYLVEEQNKLSHLSKRENKEPIIPDLLMNYITELIQFRNFPLYYLLPHEDLSTEESIKYYKIDNSWILAFLFGIFSAGQKLSLIDFGKYLFENPKNIFEEKLDKISLDTTSKSNLIKILNSPQETKSNTAQEIDKFVNLYMTQITEGNIIEELRKILLTLKSELWYVFNLERDYYGILLQSQTIKNWPHIVVELNGSHDFHYVTSINSTLRLYITDKPFSKIEMYLKNENAHFGIEYKGNEGKKITISANEDSVATANNNLYKQPHVVFNLK